MGFIVELIGSSTIIVILGGVPAFELLGVTIDDVELLNRENSFLSSSVTGKGFSENG